MAFQPKSYRKFVVASASAALVGAAVAPASAGAAEATTAADAFSDVTVDTPHYEHINALYQKGIISGFEDGEFKRDEYVPRSQAAEMIFNALGLEEVDDLSSFTFTDVNDRLKGEIQALVNEEVFDGHSETDFGYGENLTREQMAKIIAEAFDLPQKNVPDADFTDLMDTKLYPFINAVAAAGVVDGYEDGSFGVGDPIKRGDFAKMLHNVLPDPVPPQDTLEDVEGSVDSTLPGVYSVTIPLTNLKDATKDSMVTLTVGDETIELAYDEELDAFADFQVSGYEVEELKAGIVDVETPEVKTVADLNGGINSTLPGVFTVDISFNELQAEGVAKEDTVTLMIGEDSVAELTYDEELDAFANFQVSGYSEEELMGATVTSN
ncbi:S-layer homology domain-containing protein [Pontibacillus sp. ALD_SL1]|uniref:S-layer homology domain-containing protein n=1 Tax=Pontibacillus sp. ALD_SL1 TaxID=2777185 RepID=UPI001A96A763|nr:S-layer homology domain-containing protein [Pontibacillus sp. ALD_SL1]QSS99802.1 S-layer homology domain-containing protein [Pontibacillus sp. ALD_SL1]